MPVNVVLPSGECVCSQTGRYGNVNIKVKILIKKTTLLKALNGHLKNTDYFDLLKLFFELQFMFYHKKNPV